MRLEQVAAGVRVQGLDTDGPAEVMAARWIGSDPNAPAVGTGSHSDAIPNAGKYDGVVGVLGGLEAIRALQQSGFHPTSAIELLIFTSEEPTRFGIGCLGSRLLSGTLSPQAAGKLTDRDGASTEEVRRKGNVAPLNTRQIDFVQGVAQQTGLATVDDR